MLDSCDEKEIKDVVVIGGGLMGSSAAWQLSNYDEEVLLIEQQDVVYTSGSSYGEARISRSLGSRGDIFSYLQWRGISETQKLIDFLNQADTEKHELEDIYTTSPVTYIYYDHQQAVVDDLLDGQTDPFEYVTTAEEADKLFDVKAPNGSRIIREYKKHSGTINPNALISKLQKGIEFKRSTIWYNSKVTSLKKKNDLYKIEIIDTKTGEKKTLLSRKIISAAGSYTGTLLKEVAPYFGELITPKRVLLAYFKITKSRYEVLTAEQKQKILDFYPVADFTPETMFSMIERIDGDGIPILKIGGHFKRSDISNMNRVWQQKLSKEEVDWSKTSMLNYLKFLNLSIEPDELELVNSYSCVYSLTKSEVPLVTNILAEDKLSKDPNLVTIAGMSGVGAKGSLTYGLIAADLLLGRECSSAMYQKTKEALGFERLIKGDTEVAGCVRVFGGGMNERML